MEGSLRLLYLDTFRVGGVWSFCVLVLWILKIFLSLRYMSNALSEETTTRHFIDVIQGSLVL